ncbi:MAG TPA: NrfD/PsrC family molybdoenzyme membrane anchor subunit [Gemmatimonadales bacterium]
MPDTFYTAAPHWTWYIVAYFFIGGIAGTAFLLAASLHFFSRPGDRPLVRIGYYVAFVGAVLSGILLIVDLNRPERFWHMMIESNTGRPMFKSWVPMSVGVWGVLLFGLFSFLAALSVTGEDRPGWRFTRWAPVRALGGRVPAAIIAVLGALFGLFLAGYTGVLLSVTNRPIWADSNLLGLLFLVSGASTGAATLYLLARRRGVGTPASLAWLSWFDERVLVLELLVLIAFLVSLGPVAEVLVGWWGVLLLGVVVAGIAVPLWLVHGSRGGHRAVQAAVLVLIGGFLLRVVVILSSHDIYVWGSGVARP